MIKIDYRWVGVSALGVFAAVSVAGASSLLRMLPSSYSAVIFLLGFVATIILAEIWAVMYWRASRNIISTTTLAILDIAIVGNLLYLVPVFRVIFNRLF
jgi:hypothetical protein